MHPYGDVPACRYFDYPLRFKHLARLLVPGLSRSFRRGGDQVATRIGSPELL